ncbi:putative ABC transporter ATP-binding protein YxlF [bacterium BMS3Abin05]|nr:putative ABC transporter ATP-binding protein YxlF [bacterium BMS3Abin05]GBE28145.1 putative ABC transporter ATP-binding protein YxlF [bacterium BMS3Bbin03]HDL78087.1 ATP-binding cassette domain-containing protein [Bacteroidota bacterium]HDZ12049.1 ATP-binding cassette domain-containing protein [Bacteroidota bacterium]
MIEVKNLTRYFGQKPAIQDITFNVEKGEVLGFLGPNAAGKTTTMRILTCFIPATSGTAKVAGFDVFEQSMDVRKHIGYLPENPPLYLEMTVESYLKFVGKIKGVDSKNMKKQVDKVMDLANIENVRSTIIGKLSKGYRQRVGLAQALVHDPEVLILDEPTAGLDPKQIIDVRKLIKNLGGERTVILSTHILPEASQTCSRIVIINEGRVVAEDSPENLMRRLQGNEKIYVEVAGPEEAVANELQGLDSVASVAREKETNGKIAFIVESIPNRDIRAELAKTIVQKGWGLFEMRPIGMSLEDVFLRLTTKEEEVLYS